MKTTRIIINHFADPCDEQEGVRLLPVLLLGLIIPLCEPKDVSKLLMCDVICQESQLLYVDSEWLFIYLHVILQISPTNQSVLAPELLLHAA